MVSCATDSMSYDVHNTRQPELVGALSLAVRLGPRPTLLIQSRDASKLSSMYKLLIPRDATKLDRRAEQRPAVYRSR